MNIGEVETLRRLLPGIVAERADQLSSLLRSKAANQRRLLIVGTPDAEEPWHLAAHLALAARRSGLPNLSPLLVRHDVPLGAPAHLAHPLARLSAGDSDETVLVMAPTQPGTPLLDRLQDARRRGALIVNIENRPTELVELAHESLTLDTREWPAVTAGLLHQRAEIVQHLLGNDRRRSRIRTPGSRR